MKSERRKAYKKLAIVSAIAENAISRNIAKAKDARSGLPFPIYEMQAMFNERPIKEMINTPAHLFGSNLKIDPRRLRRHNRREIPGRIVTTNFEVSTPLLGNSAQLIVKDSVGEV